MPNEVASGAANAPAGAVGAVAAVRPSQAQEVSSRAMGTLVLDLVRPYRLWLVVVFIAMLVETAMSLAGPWPLKIMIDNVLGSHKLPDWLRWVDDLAGSKMALAGFAAAGVLVIAVVGAIATYIDNYYTESLGQWVANDLRIRIHDHLQRLALAFYDKQQTGVLLSTITNDVATVQNFASSNTLGILVDLLTIVGIVGLMFWLNWDFALIAVGFTPFLLLFVARFKKAVKKATHEVRRNQADIVADRRRRDDHRRAHGLPRLPDQVLQARAGSGEDDQCDRPDLGRPGANPGHPGGRQDDRRAGERA